MKLAVILGSVRQNRMSERLAAWVVHEATAREGTQVDLVDLKDFPMPFFDEPVSPRFNQNRQVNEVAQQWLARLQAADAYIFVTPEYDHTIPGVLTNALDYVTWEVMQKPATVVSHGTVGGARATMHLKEILSESRAAIIPTQLAVIGLSEKIDAGGNLSEAEKTAPYGLRLRLDSLLVELQWYSDALAAARAKS